MIFTEEKLDVLLALQKELEQVAERILDTKCQIETGRSYLGTIERIWIEDGAVQIKTDNSCGRYSCGDDYEYYDFPLSYLYDGQWQEELKKKIEEKKQKEEKKKQEEEQKRKEEQEKRERTEFERLKKKFETLEGGK